MPDTNELQITDFRMAGFLLSRGARFKKAEVRGQGDEVVFCFDNTPNGTGISAEDLLNQYPGSAEQQYDSACRTMHDFVKVTQDRHRKRGRQ